MDRVIRRIVCFVLVSALFCLGLVGCAAGTAQQPSRRPSAKTKAQLRREREAEAAAKARAKREQKARAAEELRVKREAAARAKREGAARAKAEREEKARLKKERKAKAAAAAKEEKARLKQERKAKDAAIAKGKREQKARAAEALKAKREAAVKAKREATARAKAKRGEKARAARLNAEAEKQAKAEIAQAAREKKAKLAALDARTKKQAKEQAKRQAEEIKAQRASLKRKFGQDKAKLAAEHKQAKARITKEEKKRLEAEYKRTLSRLKGEYDVALARLEQKAKAEGTQYSQAKSRNKADLVALSADAKKLAKETKAQQANLKTTFNKDKSRIAAERKQTRAAAKKRKATKSELARLDAKYKGMLDRREAEYKNALARLEGDADAEAVQISQARTQKKADLAELDAKAKKQTKEIKAERASLKRKFDQDKRKAGKVGKHGLAKLDAEYKENLDLLSAEYNKDLAELKEKAKAQTTQYARQKKQIEDEYEQAVARAKLKVRQQKEKAQVEQLKMPVDTTPRLTVKELRINGNTLISTGEILENMPVVYNASDKPLQQAESDYLYDFRVLRDIVVLPGEPRQVSARTIQGLTQYVLSCYQDEDYAGIYVYVPQQAIREGRQLQDGILPVEVLEAEITEVTVKSYDPNQNQVEKGYLRSSAVLEWSPVKTGEVANQKELDDFVNLLNLNPDRYVSAVVTKGAEERTLAVAYDVYEADPWHWFVQADNSGTRDRQWAPRIGVINTNLLGIDDTFTAIYQAPWDSQIDEDYSVYGSYDFPLLGPRLRLNLYGGYSQFDVSPEAGDIDFIGNGDFYGGILRYNVLQTDSWFFDLTGSLSHERSKVTPSLFPSILGTDVRFWLWDCGVDLHRSDDMSNSSVAFKRYESMGGESGGSEFTLARTNAKSDFSIYTGSAAHSQYMDPNKIGRFSSTFRWVGSNERLVPAKMTTFGGMYTVRGYDEYEVVADGGLLASAQYEFDLVKYEQSKEIGKAQPEETEAEAEMPFVRKLAPLVFFDYGRSKVRHPIATEHGHVEMYSVGAGMIVELGDNFSGGVYYGYPLTPTDDTRTGKGRLNVGVMMRW